VADLLQPVRPVTATLLQALALVATVNPCDLPAEARAPDLRCGETLDGRLPADTSVPRQVGQAALRAPRLVAQGALWPVLRTADAVEHHHALDWMRAILTTDDGLVGVRPEFHYSTSFYPTGGLNFFYGRLPGRGQVALRGLTAGPSIVLGQLSARGPEALGLALLLTYDRRNDRLFAGIGPQTEGELAAAGRGIARYASDNLGGTLSWARPLPRGFAVEVHGDLQRRDFRATRIRGGPSVAQLFGLPAELCTAQSLGASCVDEAQLPSFGQGVRLASLGVGVLFDRREPTRDGSGVSVDTDATISRGVAGDPSRHASLSTEGVAAIGGHDRLFLLRARAAMVERLSSAPIPFDELVIPSGLNDMRGFATGRFRGQSGLMGTAEYRWYVSNYLDGALFADVGTVAGPHFSGLNWSRWFPTFGLGLRLYQVQSMYWKARSGTGVQLAYAPREGLRMLFTLAGF
jgi:hypothetical protein